MNISIRPVREEELEKLLHMQQSSFQELFKKYQDHDTNPAAESIEKIHARYAQKGSKYFFILSGDIEIGAIRVILEECNMAKISPMFIMPEYQNSHCGQEAVRLIEREYPFVAEWRIDTILQEEKLCHFYEKLGYNDTGRREKIKENMEIIFYSKKCR